MSMDEEFPRQMNFCPHASPSRTLYAPYLREQKPFMRAIGSPAGS